jgi:NolX protein
MENFMSLLTSAAQNPERINLYTSDQKPAKSDKKPIDQAPAGMLNIPMDQGMKQLEAMLGELLKLVGGDKKEDPMGLAPQGQAEDTPEFDPLGDSGGELAPEEGAVTQRAPTQGGAPAAGGMSAEESEARGAAKDLKAESAIQRNIDKLPKKMDDKDIEKLIKDKNTPPDLKEALQHLQSPDGADLKKRLDTAAKGGDADGTISKKDFKASAENPELQKYNQDKSKEFVKNYIPSDAPKGDTTPRQMTGADAAREMYKYSDSLPKHVDEKALKDIVSGKSGKQAPPQLMAAAQYYLDNPKEFKATDRDKMQDNLSQKIRLTDKEKTTVDNLDKDKDIFFKDGQKPNREKLEEMAGDKKLSPRVRETAKELLTNPTLFGMIENAKLGHDTNLIKKNNDGKMSAEDVSIFKKNLTTENTAKAPPHVYAPKTQFSAEIGQEMADGVANQPDAKKSEGGELDKFGKNMLKVGSKVLDAIQIAADITASIAKFIPGVNAIVMPIALGVAAGTNALNNLGVKPYLDHIENGTSMKDAEKKGAISFGIGLAGTAMSAVSLPGMGAPTGAAATAALGAGKGAAEAAAEGAKAGATVGATKAAEVGAKVAGTTTLATTTGGVTAAGTEGAEFATREGAEFLTREGAEAGAVEGAEAGAREGIEASATGGLVQGGAASGGSAAGSGANVTTKEGSEAYASWLAKEKSASTVARESAEGAGAGREASRVIEPLDMTSREGQEAFLKALGLDTSKKMASGAVSDAGMGYVADSGIYANLMGNKPEPIEGPEVPVIAQDPPEATPAA